MKNLTRIIVLLLLFTVSQACSDILDNAQPSTAISPEQTLSNAGAVESLRSGMYSRLHTEDMTTTYMLGPSSAADELTTRAGATRLSGLAQNDRNAGMVDADGYGLIYDLINDANLIINGVEEGVLPDAQQAQYTGEALTLRAFALHHLVRTYGYEPGMIPSSGQGAGWDLGTIIRTQPTIEPSDASFRPRKTINTVYDQIESDLTRAINLLSQGDAGSPVYITQAAAEALYARVSLYRQNFSDAAGYATDAMASSSAELVTDSTGVANMFDETAGRNPEAIFLINFNPPSEQINGDAINDGLNAYTATQWMAQVPTQEQLDMYSSADYRVSWFAPCFNDAESSPVSGCPATHPEIAGGNEGLEIQKWNGELGSFTDNVPVFRVAEMLLIQAEAQMKESGGTVADALPPLNTLREARGLSELTVADITSEQEAMNAILAERRREFVAEGQRFYDLKRLGRDISKAPGTPTSDVPYIDYRILDNIPYGEVTLSQQEAPEDSVLQQNPGY